MAKGNSWMIWSVVALIAQVVHGDTFVPVTLLHSAVPKGAVCLDGSAPAYSYLKGSRDSWIVYLQGGGWCYDLSNCYNRTRTYLGNSHRIKSPTTFSALLDSNCTSNPDFCDWHKVVIFYCDGSSFMSDILDSKGNLYFRGARIFNVMMEEMLAKGMRNTKQAILSGSSAGGLATMLHCDNFRKLFSNASRVKCISDSGFFLHGKGLPGLNARESYIGAVIKTHELSNSLPSTCTSKRNASLCLFPEYFAGDIQTPLFIIESAFDRTQAKRVLGSSICTDNLMSCNTTELRILRDLRRTFIKTLVGLKNSSNRGIFLHSCYVHTHINDWTHISLANKTIGEAVLDWYHDRSSVREIDTKNELPRNCTNFDNKSPASMPCNRFTFIISYFLVIIIFQLF